jgi:hypothetical protein
VTPNIQLKNASAASLSDVAARSAWVLVDGLAQQQRYHKQQRYHSSNPAAAMAPGVKQYHMQPAIPLGRRRHPRVRRIMVLRRSFRNKMLSAEQFFSTGC